ncbi:MAG: ribbon-helix-helix domain-containing protein [Candidatus Woesearchaeota archaeon]
MNTQINVRVPDNLLDSAKEYAEKHGYGNVQNFIRETMREKMFDEPSVTAEELKLVKTLIKASREKNLYGTEEELFEKLK